MADAEKTMASECRYYSSGNAAGPNLLVIGEQNDEQNERVYNPNTNVSHQNKESTKDPPRRWGKGRMRHDRKQSKPQVDKWGYRPGDELDCNAAFGCAVPLPRPSLSPLDGAAAFSSWRSDSPQDDPIGEALKTQVSEDMGPCANPDVAVRTGFLHGCRKRTAGVHETHTVALQKNVPNQVELSASNKKLQERLAEQQAVITNLRQTKANLRQTKDDLHQTIANLQQTITHQQQIRQMHTRTRANSKRIRRYSPDQKAYLLVNPGEKNCLVNRADDVQVGPSVVINPGGPTGESADIDRFGSVILTNPLK